MNSFFPVPLGDYQATSSIPYGTKRSVDTKTFVWCKNTDAASLAPGMCCTGEDTSLFQVDKAAAGEVIYGVVPRDYTGKTIPVNGGFWLQTRGNVKARYAGSGAGGVVAGTACIISGTLGNLCRCYATTTNSVYTDHQKMQGLVIAQETITTNGGAASTAMEVEIVSTPWA